MHKPRFEFDFALSFAGQDRSIAEALGRLLEQGGASVFYDRSCRSWLLGKRWADVIACAYVRRSRFFVLLASEHYGTKHFPLREFIAAKEEESRRPEEFILPLRLDDAPLPGLDPDVVYIDLRQVSLDEASDVLLAKLRGMPGPEMHMPDRWVATFGLLIEDVLRNWRLPEEVDRHYPVLCDWFEEDLERRLTRAGLEDLDQPEASSRNGECLSVRFAFTIEGDPASLDFGELHWWEVLELMPFSSVYPE